MQPRAGNIAVSKMLLKLLQVHLPPIAHALLFAVDALAMRHPPPDRKADTGATSSLTGAITTAVNKANAGCVRALHACVRLCVCQQRPLHARMRARLCVSTAPHACSPGGPAAPETLVDKALAQAARTSASGAPSVALRDLLQPQAPIDEHCNALLAKVLGGDVRDALVRVVRACAARSYVPLVPLYAGIAGWRKHLSLFPATAPLNAELKEVRARACMHAHHAL